MKTLLTATDVDALPAGALLDLPPGTLLTPGARDRLRERGIEVRERAVEEPAGGKVGDCGCGCGGSGACGCGGPDGGQASVAPRPRPRPPREGVNWSIPFERRGLDTGLFGTRRRPASPMTAVAVKPSPAGPVAAPMGAWVISVSGPDAPGRLSSALREIEALGPVGDLRHRTEGGLLRLAAVACATGPGSAAEVERRLEAMGLVALFHRIGGA